MSSGLNPVILMMEKWLIRVCRLLARQAPAALKFVARLQEHYQLILDFSKLIGERKAASAHSTCGIVNLDFRENPCLVRRRVEFFNL